MMVSREALRKCKYHGEFRFYDVDSGLDFILLTKERYLEITASTENIPGEKDAN